MDASEALRDRRVWMGVAAVVLAIGAAAVLQRHRPQVRLAVTAMTFQGPIHLGDGTLIPREASELVFHGEVDQPCSLFVFSIDRTGRVWRFQPRIAHPRPEGDGEPGGTPAPAPLREEDAGDAVEAGPWRLGGGYQLDPGPAAVRLYAVCGPESLRFPQLEAAVRAASEGAAGGEAAVQQAEWLDGLPEETAQVTRLYRFGG